MAFRRPRVKVAANILGASVRRKLKQSNTALPEASSSTNGDESINKNESDLKLFSNEDSNESAIPKENDSKASQDEMEVDIPDNKLEHADSVTNTSCSNETKETSQAEGIDDRLPEIEILQSNTLITTETITEDDSKGNGEILSEFKRPLNVEVRCDTSSNSLEGNVLQSDLQKTTQPFNTSPSKHQCRQRIRPTPAFGQRRNSLVGSLANEEQSYGDAAIHAPSHKNDRHNVSLSVTNNSPSNTISTRIPSNKSSTEQPVETNCSTTVDTTTNHKLRKTEEQLRTYRQQSRRDFDARFCNGVPDKSIFKMSDLIYYNPDTNPLQHKSDIKMESTIAGTNLKLEGSTDPPSESENNSAMPVPQLKLNANGELILDDESLVIETTAEQAARKMLANSSVVYHDENTVGNSFHKRKKRSREWEAGETIKFYRCLQTIGTDFSLMVSLFPNRTRRDLKVKFKKEERINGNLINKALLHPKQFNVDEMQRQIQIDEEERLAKLQQMRERKKVKKIRLKRSKEKRRPKQSAADRVLSGDDIYELEKQEISSTLDDSLPQQDVDGSQPQFASEETNNHNNLILNSDSSCHDTEMMNLELSAYDEENQLLQLLSEDLENDTNVISSVTELDQNLNTNANCQMTNTPEDIKLLSVEVEQKVSEGGDSAERGEIVEEEEGGDAGKGRQEEEEEEEEVICSLDSTECDIEEDDIQCVLNDLAENNLVLVSTTDPDNPNITINEIYKIDRNSGALYDKPLNIPNNVIQSISSIMSEIT